MLLVPLTFTEDTSDCGVWGFLSSFIRRPRNLKKSSNFIWNLKLVTSKEIGDYFGLLGIYELSALFVYRTRAIISRSWIQAIHKDRIFWKKLLKNKEMVFGNGVKNIQAAAYNGARTVCANCESHIVLTIFVKKKGETVAVCALFLWFFSN